MLTRIFKHWHRKPSIPLIFTEGEFLEKIVNIPRNGEWRDSRNLEKYLVVARDLRYEGINEALIIKYLTALYVASSLETNMADIPFKTFSTSDIRALLELNRKIDEF